MSGEDTNKQSPINWLEIPISGLIERQAQVYSARIAVETPEAKISYRHLNVKANGLCDLIKKHSGKHVAVITSDFAEHLTALFGVFKSEKIAISLDPSLPLDTLIGILSDLHCQLIVSTVEDKELIDQIQSLSKRDIKIVFTDDVEEKQTNPMSVIRMDLPAIIMFTSGSTSQPKGVIKSHEFIMHDLMIRSKKYQMNTEDRVMITNDLFFGRTFFTALSTIFGGATMVLKNLHKEGINSLPKWLSEKGITIFSPTGSTLRGLNSILNGTEQFSNLRIIRIGAEAIYGRDLNKIRKCISDQCLIWVNYGSTETGSIASYIFKKSDSVSEGTLPVGFPYEGKEIRIIDEQGEEVASEGVGEITVISRYLTSGYLNEKSSQKPKYVVDKSSNLTTYFTGDIGRKRRDGMLELEGRSDQVVKVRGYRIDISYVEERINQLDEITEAAVTVFEHSYSKRLIGFVVPNKAIPSSELRGKLSHLLPAYMIPSRLITLDALPRLSNGKVDRKSLAYHPSIEDSVPIDQHSLDEVSKSIRAIWIEALGHSDFDIFDNFFDVGGDSIGAAVMISDVEKHFQLELSSEVFWQDATIKGMSETIRLKAPSSELLANVLTTDDDFKLSDQKKKLLNKIVEEIKWTNGRAKLWIQRGLRPKLNFLLVSFIREFRDGNGFTFFFDWCHVTSIKLLLATMQYGTSVKVLSKLIFAGMAPLLIPRNRRKIIKKFNYKINPHLSREQLYKCYLFYMLQEYNIIHRAIIPFKNGQIKNLTLKLEGEEIFKDAIEKGNGVLLVGNHTTASLWMVALDMDILTIGNMGPLLESHGLGDYKLAVSSGLISTAIRRLKAGKVVKVVADGREGKGKKHLYSIAGFQKEISTGFAELALKTGASVIPLTSYMSDPFNVTIRFDKAFITQFGSISKDQQLHELTSQYASMLQKQATKYPWQIKINHIMNNS